MITLTLRHYLSRFGWEIATFWLVSLGNTVLLMKSAPPAVLSAMAVLEIIALAWITVRLVLAEDGFRTSGGWRARPFPNGVRHFLPLALAAAVVLLPAIARSVASQRMFGGIGVWTDFGPGSWIRQILGWFVFFALPLKLFGLLVLQGFEGRLRTAAWAALALILLPVISARGTAFGKRKGDYQSMGGNEPRLLAQGIQRELPDATDFIGGWNDPVDSPQIPAAKLLLKLSLDADPPSDGIVISSSVAGLRGSRVNVRLRALFKDPLLAGSLEKSIAILRYADGTCATCQRVGNSTFGPPLPFFPATEWLFSGDFVSPLCLPEFEGDPRQLTHGLELLFFNQDWDRPEMPVDPLRQRNDGMDRKGMPFDPRTMQQLFTQFPWPDQMWRKTALPFLTNKATREDIPFLLEKMRMDPRLLAVFANKQWMADAMPLLRELAKERIPLGSLAVSALGAEKDPALADDLLVIAVQLESGLEGIEPALRAQPGFDWPAFARELWHRKKYSTDWVERRENLFLPALWAAQEGEHSAFRVIAEQAALGKKSEAGYLPRLVMGEHTDLIGYLRENIDRMTFDATTRKWTR